MAKSKKQAAAIEKRLGQLGRSLAQMLEQAEEMEREIQNWPPGTRTISDERQYRMYADLRREMDRVHREIIELESLRSPGPGRSSNPLVQRILQERAGAVGKKPSIRQLAIKHLKDPNWRKGLVGAVKKAEQRARRKTFPK